MELFLKTFSKILFGVGALLFATLAHAVYESNALFGVDVGVLTRKGSVDIAYGNVPGAVSLEQDGLIWGLLAGYQGRCKGWLLGGELHVDWDRAQKASKANFSTTTNAFVATAVLRRHMAVGFSARLGKEVLPDLFSYTTVFLPYVRLGIETSKDHLELDIRNANSFVYSDSEGSRRDWRFVLGLGVEMPVPQIMGLSIRAEYDYLPEGRRIETFGYTVDFSTLVTSITRSHTHRGKVAFVWNFV